MATRGLFYGAVLRWWNALTLTQLLSQLPEVAQPPALPLREAGQPAIELDGASFAWKAAAEGGQPALQDVNLQVLPVAPPRPVADQESVLQVLCQCTLQSSTRWLLIVADCARHG